MDAAAIRKQVGHRIKVRRVELYLKQEDLGARVGVPQSQISEWEIGRRALKIEQAMELAKALDTTVGYLVGEAESREAEGGTRRQSRGGPTLGGASGR